jgi:hypothetical protein
MATLTRLGREPTATADLVDTWSRDVTKARAGNLGNRRIPPTTNYQVPESLVWADLTRLIEQLHAEARVIHRLLRHKKREGPEGLRQG